MDLPSGAVSTGIVCYQRGYPVELILCLEQTFNVRAEVHALGKNLKLFH